MNNIKNVLRPFIDFFYSSLTNISPVLNTQVRYFRHRKCFANLSNPKTFTEKLSWLKLYKYNNDKLVKICADKLLVRSYLKKCGLQSLLNDVYAVYREPEEINWDKLPESFVLKWNFGSGYNYICKNKKEININEVTSLLKKWGRKKYWLLYSELQYQVDTKYIICEQYLDNDKELLVGDKIVLESDQGITNDEKDILESIFDKIKENNLENLVTFQRALLHINKIIPCDYWDFLKGNRKKFNGFYLSSYDWSLDTQTYLNSLIEY